MSTAFPLNRFSAYDLVEIARSSPIEHDENDINIELRTDSYTLSLCFPKQSFHSENIPGALLEVLSQLNRIDNIVQSSCERNAANSSLPISHHRHEPAIIYLQEDGVIFIDYWGLEVNNQWAVYLAKKNNEWLPYTNDSFTQPL